MCQFVDDSLSAFKFNELQRATVDTAVDWIDVDLLAARPVGMREVWAGYDPQESEDGDNAALVIALPPLVPGGKFRLLERHQIKGDFQTQADFVMARLARYNCTYLGIDKKGIGAAVYQLLRDRMRGVVALEYSLESKTQMVMKAQHTFARQRVEFDGSWIDLQSSFLSIKKALTGSGRAITFRASRNDEIGHADLAWATMHIFINEPLDGQARPRMSMEIIGGEEGSAADVAGGDVGGIILHDRRQSVRGRNERAGDRRVDQRRELRVRRPGTGAGTPPVARSARMLAQRPLVRAAGAARRAGARVPRQPASQLRYHAEGQPARRVA
jgi:hypothetical protein